MLCVNTRLCHQNASKSRYNDITRSDIDRRMLESLEELGPREVDCSLTFLTHFLFSFIGSVKNNRDP